MNKEKIIDKLCEVGNINPTSSEDIEKGFREEWKRLIDGNVSEK